MREYSGRGGPCNLFRRLRPRCRCSHSLQYTVGIKANFDRKTAQISLSKIVISHQQYNNYVIQIILIETAIVLAGSSLC